VPARSGCCFSRPVGPAHSWTRSTMSWGPGCLTYTRSSWRHLFVGPLNNDHWRVCSLIGGSCEIDYSARTLWRNVACLQLQHVVMHNNLLWYKGRTKVARLGWPQSNLIVLSPAIEDFAAQGTILTMSLVPHGVLPSSMAWLQSRMAATTAPHARYVCTKVDNLSIIVPQSPNLSPLACTACTVSLPS
jgi:hypothetical protein